MSAGTLVINVVAGLALAGGFVAQMVRWLRVLQREHYDPSSMIRFLGRWSSPPAGAAGAPDRIRNRRPFTLSHFLFIALLVTVLLGEDALVVLTSMAYGWFCPWGLGLRGRTGQLRWTRRLTTIAVVSSTVAVLIAALGVLSPRPWLLAVSCVWAVPPLLDVTTRVLEPFERRAARRYVDQAAARLARVHPMVVAITGSYGKTSTKNHLVDLLRDEGAVMASPRSYNNRAGLSKAINEHLADGTRVFVAEMGTYGPGEIRDLCSWCVPDVAVVTAIGPVHLERMRSLEVIEQAKFEITERAGVVILNVDDPRLARWVPRLEGQGKRVVRAGSKSAEVDIRVRVHEGSWVVVVGGDELASVPIVAGLQPTNVACALAAALETGAAPGAAAARMSGIAGVANRAQVGTAGSGVVVIDDTFNANPSSATASLDLLWSLPLGGRRVVVTPGLIELGSLQYGENLSLAQKVLARGGELVVVGRTNVVPMAIGAEQRLRRFDTREQAVEWVRSALVPGDGVLYLNDLPDHYP
ncbi:MAG TPA: UDP-N-acetylmuramoyl-tripeptide--D-alanyl-D-alanine ligase [Acidimicrobiales bacterium]|nr:UDP-N-acetylmuramoyl-tripeptide--D-alanyl-D-alanine ligase [Acidimicrobiales bacterium]